MDEDYRYTQANLDDAPAISRLISSVVEEFVIPDFSPRGAKNMRAIISEQAIRGYIEQGIDYHLATFSSQIVGVLAIKQRSHIYHFFVDKSHQKKKVAYNLWRRWQALDPQPRITVSSSKFAMAFYHSLGFKQHQPKVDINDIVSFPMLRERELEVLKE